MIAWRSIFRINRVLKFPHGRVKLNPVCFSQGHCSFNSLSRGVKGRQLCTMGGNKKQKITKPVWRPVSMQANSTEESVVKNVSIETQVVEPVTGVSNDGDAVLETIATTSAEKHSLSLEVGASVIRFIRGREGSTQKSIEEETGVQIILPTSRKEDFIAIEGGSAESSTKATEKIKEIIDEAVRSPSLDYSHFVSLPLAIHPELVDKLVKFQNTILGISDTGDDASDDDPNENSSELEGNVQQLAKASDVAVELKVNNESNHVKVDVKSIPLVSYQPKATKTDSSTPTVSDMGIEKSIFIKPKTFHLTVLMLKLWNKDRVHAASEVVKSISSSVVDALENRPLSIRLRGLDSMKGPLAKARVLYVPVEEIGNEGRLLRACQVIINAFIEAGLVLEKDAKQSLKLHATVMNARHRKRKTRSRKVDSFDARGIFEQFGSEDWGEYLIPEVHLSQRFVFDESGYYHRCASIPFPQNAPAESMDVE